MAASSPAGRSPGSGNPSTLICTNHEVAYSRDFATTIRSKKRGSSASGVRLQGTRTTTWLEECSARVRRPLSGVTLSPLLPKCYDHSVSALKVPRSRRALIALRGVLLNLDCTYIHMHTWSATLRSTYDNIWYAGVGRV